MEIENPSKNESSAYASSSSDAELQSSASSSSCSGSETSSSADLSSSLSEIRDSASSSSLSSAAGDASTALSSSSSSSSKSASSSSSSSAACLSFPPPICPERDKTKHVFSIEDQGFLVTWDDEHRLNDSRTALGNPFAQPMVKSRSSASYPSSYSPSFVPAFSLGRGHLYTVETARRKRPRIAGKSGILMTMLKHTISSSEHASIYAWFYFDLQGRGQVFKVPIGDIRSITGMATEDQIKNAEPFIDAELRKLESKAAPARRPLSARRKTSSSSSSQTVPPPPKLSKSKPKQRKRKRGTDGDDDDEDEGQADDQEVSSEEEEESQEQIEIPKSNIRVKRRKTNATLKSAYPAPSIPSAPPSASSSPSSSSAAPSIPSAFAAASAFSAPCPPAPTYTFSSPRGPLLLSSLPTGETTLIPFSLAGRNSQPFPTFPAPAPQPPPPALPTSSVFLSSFPASSPFAYPPPSSFSSAIPPAAPSPVSQPFFIAAQQQQQVQQQQPQIPHHQCPAPSSTAIETALLATMLLSRIGI